VAVSKTFPADYIHAAADEGQIDFGENKVQEALPKMALTSGRPIRWHLVGHLQSNKAKKAGAHFDVIQSVDRVDLVTRLDDAAREAGRGVELLVQVDLAGESTKHGARPDELPAIFEAARHRSHARIVGLMLLPPAFDDPDQSRPYFRALREVRDRLLADGVPRASVRDLS